MAGIGPVLHIRCVNLSGVMVQIEKGAYSVGHSSVKGKVCQLLLTSGLVHIR